jgi:hypothetical protein
MGVVAVPKKSRMSERLRDAGAGGGISAEFSGAVEAAGGGGCNAGPHGTQHS